MVHNFLLEYGVLMNLSIIIGFEEPERRSAFDVVASLLSYIVLAVEYLAGEICMRISNRALQTFRCCCSLRHGPDLLIPCL